MAKYMASTGLTALSGSQRIPDKIYFGRKSAWLHEQGKGENFDFSQKVP